MYGYRTGVTHMVTITEAVTGVPVNDPDLAYALCHAIGAVRKDSAGDGKWLCETDFPCRNMMLETVILGTKYYLTFRV